MIFEKLIAKIQRYNTPMATKIIQIRAKYKDLYDLDALSFERAVIDEIVRGVKCGDYKTPKEDE